METVYELLSLDACRPVLVAPLGEYFRAKWVKADEHNPPTVVGEMAKTISAMAISSATGHAAPQHTGFALAAFAQRGIPPVDLPDEVPGVHIGIDLDAKRVRVFDPLETLPNRKEIHAAFAAFYHKHVVPHGGYVHESLSTKDLQAWKAWLDSAVQQGLASVVRDEQPAVEPVIEPASELVAEPVATVPEIVQEPAKEPDQVPPAELAPVVEPKAPDTEPVAPTVTASNSVRKARRR